METEEVMLKKVKGPYRGYVPQTVYEHSGTPLVWDLCKPLLRIPPKVTFFFDRSKIDQVRKTTHEEDPRDNSYFLKLVDDSFIEVIY